MTSSIDIWIEFILRFSHLVAGIAWIGSSFYFIWLDSSFSPPQIPRNNVEGEVFMVHGGFYYQVEKRKIYPGELPPVLHWFKWEATLTWMTGLLLLIYIFYFRGASLLIDPRMYPLTQLEAILLSLSIGVVSWVIYDLIWHPKFNLNKYFSISLSFLFLFGLIFLNTKLFSGRGAFIQTGAVLGSLMLLNVWVRILPGQKKMIQDAEQGKVPDYSLSIKSKVRSVHNTYFIFPVLFIMLSNHYPLLYSHPQNWLLLIFISLAGALVRHVMVTTARTERWLLVPALIALLLAIFLTSHPMQIKSVLPASSVLPMPSSQPQSLIPGPDSANPSQHHAGAPIVNYDQIQTILAKRCGTCHSTNPTDEIFKVAPKGLVLETQEQVEAAKDRIYQQVIATRIMPLGNKTNMSEAERNLLQLWLRR